MSKALGHTFLLEVIAASLLLGLLITFLSSLYTYTTKGQYCNPDSTINVRTDCSLQVNNRGLPLTYTIDPDYQPRHGIQAVALIADIIVWSGVSFVVVLLAKGRHHYA